MRKFMAHALSSTQTGNEDEPTVLFDFPVVSENPNLLRFALGAAIVQIKFPTQNFWNIQSDRKSMKVR